MPFSVGVLPPVKNDRMVSLLPANPTILNPILASDGYAGEVTSLIFDRMVTWNVDTGEPEPKLAESWSVSKDGLTYLFKLRKNATWHDGKPVTAEDVKFTFDRIKDPKVDAAHLQNYFSGLESVTIKGPLEIEFKVKEPYFRNLIILGDTDILPKHIYEVSDFNKNPANRAPIGSGPYQFVKWDSGRSIQLKRFTNYWGNQDSKFKDRYNFNEILFRIITDDAVAVMAMKKGDIDVIDPTPTMFVKDFADPIYEQKFYKLKFSTEDGNGYRFIGWNLRSPKFSSKKIRQALSMSLPREEINKKVMNGLLTLAVGAFPQGSDKNDPSVKPVPYDLEKAKALLAEEGWKPDANGILTKGDQKFNFELLFVAGVPENERVALIYQQSLKAIGIEMNIKTLEWTVFLKQLEENSFDAFYMAWSSSLDSDPYQIWHSSQAVKGGSNRVGFSNKRADEILTEARKTLDKPKRLELYREFSKIIADEQPYTFVFERPLISIIDRRFENVLPVGKLGLDSSKWFTPMGRERANLAAH
ncbi:MAG: extracellular solute-binding protein family 5 [Bacteriovoracaceae bacterium]|nr:extracellular solute-binding protein family 5 [Bacteriovoracaceae bacterium]